VLADEERTRNEARELVEARGGTDHRAAAGFWLAGLLRRNYGRIGSGEFPSDPLLDAELVDHPGVGLSGHGDANIQLTSLTLAEQHLAPPHGYRPLLKLG
jgi:hypothetical protein